MMLYLQFYQTVSVPLLSQTCTPSSPCLQAQNGLYITFPYVEQTYLKSNQDKWKGQTDNKEISCGLANH